MSPLHFCLDENAVEGSSNAISDLKSGVFEHLFLSLLGEQKPSRPCFAFIQAIRLQKCTFKCPQLQCLFAQREGYCKRDSNVPRPKAIQRNT